ncbi:hypothetical protein KSC_006410 [Ktedonobacter sp. SOSP1-52]|nr:hypothetical protein KSC_006410 [Ktedonobacter sp. SOSP1-52]
MPLGQWVKYVALPNQQKQRQEQDATQFKEKQRVFCIAGWLQKER